MPRPPRLELPGVPLHVRQRGNNRAACFFGDIDRRFYLKCLAEAAAKTGCAIHAYVLMTNHVHLILTPPRVGAVGEMLQHMGRRYVRVLNTVHGRTGTLWEGRFKSSLIDTDNYLLTCYRYIDLNPVEAGMAPHPAAYRWSSYAHHAGTKTDAFITEHETILGLGRDRAERQAAYRALSDKPMDQLALAKIREAIKTSSALGSDAFLASIAAKVGRPVQPPKRGRPVKRRDEENELQPVSGKLL